MTCNYCRATNEEDAHRCHRCGRRVIETARNAGANFPASNAATAPDLAPAATLAAPAAPGLHLVNKTASEAATLPTGHPGYQASLFGPQEVSKPQAVVRREAPPPPRVRRPKTEQPRFDFPAPETLTGSAERTLYCKAPVALASHRMMAAALDLSVGFVALGLFLTTLHLSAQDIVMNAATLPLYAVVAVILSLLYRVLFCIANGDTPGMRWSGLRLVNFDGHMPTRTQRFQRLAGGCVSVVASGLGLLWALVDEERLTWHDLISKTFPTPHLD